MSTGFRQVCVTVAPEADEAVGLLLERVFKSPYTVFTHPENITATASVFLPESQRITQQDRGLIAEGLKYISKCGLNVGSCKVEIKRLKREDWANSWKRHFKPIEISDRLLVRPSWESVSLKPGQKSVVINPGLSFGTGQHETTKYCLRKIVSMRQSRSEQSLLDIGSGSGILSIAAAKLGYNPVFGLDHDLEAVRIAKVNAKRNRVDKKLMFRSGELANLSMISQGKYDIVCANLLFDLLKDYALILISQLKSNGVLILAGVLQSQFMELQKVYEKEGLKLTDTGRRAEWQSGCFIFGS